MPDEIEIETKDLQETIDELHEEREERAREAKESKWTRYISLTTALFAVVAALAALQAGKLVNEAVIVKSEAVLQQARASDTWAYYQAKGVKAQTASQTSDLLAAVPGQSAAAKRWKAEAGRQKAGQAKLKGDAAELEAKRDEKDVESAALLARHEIIAMCVTCLQVAISLAAIAALTKRKGVWVFSVVVGVFGTGLFAYGFLNRHEAAPAPTKTGAVSTEESKPAVHGEKETPSLNDGKPTQSKQIEPAGG